MEQHIVTQAVARYRVVDIVATIGNPIIVQLLRAQHKNGLISVLLVFDNGQCCEGLTQTDGIGKDTAIKLLQLVDDSEASILLEVIEFIPYNAILETRSLIRQHIFGDILQELVEDVVQGYEVDEVGSILLIDGADVVNDGVCNIFETFRVVPQLVETSNKAIGIRR